MATPAPIHFLDSHGALWATCAPSDEGAEAFGPRGTARRIDPAAVGLTIDETHRTALMAAQAAGCFVRGDEGEFDTLHPAYIAAFQAKPGEIVVIEPPSLRQYLDGDDGTAARRAADAGTRARASLSSSGSFRAGYEAQRNTITTAVAAGGNPHAALDPEDMGGFLMSDGTTRHDRAEFAAGMAAAYEDWRAGRGSFATA